jgi:protoporphyrinogen oxidase
MNPKRAIVIGAGPAGLTAAYELLTRTAIKPIVLEKSDAVGGIARTVNYKGNRIDIGGHRFFSKSDRVVDWWLRMLPLQASENGAAALQYQGMARTLPLSPDGPDPALADRVMLVRPRKSRIFYLRRFFDYPLKMSADTVRKLGLGRTLRIAASYGKSCLRPLKPEQTLEQFFINRFGDELYRTFFKSYTEKVWGLPCDRISAEWGVQRIKGLSIRATLLHAMRKFVRAPQAQTETSLIEQFMYPKLGAGQMWDETACQVRRMGGEIRIGYAVNRVLTDGARVTAVEATNPSGVQETFTGDYFFSSAPIQHLLRCIAPAPPANVLEVSDGLVYRDFITVGLLVDALKTRSGAPPVRDNWIYIQEPGVQLGRLQIFNNWSPYMVQDLSKVWLGLEYFCNSTDPFWNLPDDAIAAHAADELAKIGIIDAAAVRDATVVRMEKAYPAYFGSYNRFSEIREYVDRQENLFLLGRNGMHRYNNQDHSMLTAMIAVDNIIAGRTDHSNLWDVNTEMDHHEASN